MAKISPEGEQAHLLPKQRLKYLIERYAPQPLTSVKTLYERLRLRRDYDSTLPARRNLRYLPNDIAERLDPAGVDKNFGFLLETDVSKRAGGRYQPTQGLGKNLCVALGWVLAASYEYWPPGTSDEQYIRKKGQEIADYLHVGFPQPASIFFDVPDGWITEITHESLSSIATEEDCKEFLRATFRPEFRFINAGASIARQFETDLVRRIQSDPRRVFLLTAAAGDGKSVLAHRLARSLFLNNWRVLISEDWQSAPKFEGNLGRDGQRDTLLLVDRADDISDLNAMYVWLRRNPRLRVVLLSREIDWLQRGHSRDDPRHLHIALPTLNSEAEVESLANIFIRYRAADAAVSVETLVQRIRDSLGSSDYPHMLAAAMTACRNADFGSILNSMVKNFPNRDFLAWMAICSIGATQNLALRMGHGLACALLSENGDEAIDVGRQRFDALLDRVQSEIIPVRDGRYDLRHPDIGRHVLRQMFGLGQNGIVLTKPELERRLEQIVRAAIRLSRQARSSWHASVSLSFIDELLRFWWKSPYVEDQSVGRALFEAALREYGNSEQDKERRSVLLTQWAILERDEGNPGDVDTEFSARWLFKKAYDIDSRHLQTLNAWAILERDEGNPGDVDTEFSARWLFKKAYDIDSRDLQTLNAWAILEGKADNPGNVDTEFSARWLFKKAYDIDSRNLQTLNAWAILERNAQNRSRGTETEPYSFCWLTSKLLELSHDWGDYWVWAIDCNASRSDLSPAEQELRVEQLLGAGLKEAPKCYDLWLIAVTRQLAKDPSQINALLERALSAVAPHQKGLIERLAPTLADSGHAEIAEMMLRPDPASLIECEHLEQWLRYAVEATEKNHSVDRKLVEKAFDRIWIRSAPDHAMLFLRGRYLASVGALHDGTPDGKKGARTYFRESLEKGGSKSKVYSKWLVLELTNGNQKTPPAERDTIRNIFAGAIEEFGRRKTSIRPRLQLAELEAKFGNIGQDGQYQSARSLLRQCVTDFPDSQHVLIKWIQIERMYGDAGLAETLAIEGRQRFGAQWRADIVD